jgi:hypothetical protein
VVTSAEVKGGASTSLGSTSNSASWENRGNLQLNIQCVKSRSAQKLGLWSQPRSHQRKIRERASAARIHFGDRELGESRQPTAKDRETRSRVAPFLVSMWSQPVDM